MPIELILYIHFSISSILITAFLMLKFWNYRSKKEAKTLALMMLGAFIWGVSSYISNLTTNIRAMIILEKIEFLGVVLISVHWFVFCIQFTEYRYIMQKYIRYFYIIPSITMILLFTNRYHHLMVKSRAFVEVGPLLVANEFYGLWYWVHSLYSYFLFSLGILILLHNKKQLPLVLLKQTNMIIYSIMIPLVLSIIYLFRLNPFYPIDPTLFTFSITGIICYISLYRYKLFRLIPSARAAVAEHMSGLLFVFDNQNNLLDMNKTAENTLCLKSKQYFGKKIQEIDNNYLSVFDKYVNVQSADERITIETNMGTKYYDLKIRPLLDEHHTSMGKFVILYDVTELEHAIQVKSNFLASMSHEIRTPINSIIGFMDLLKTADYKPKEKDYHNIAFKSAEDLLAIVNSILDYSMLEAGKIELGLTIFSLNQLIDEITKMFSIHEKNLEFYCEIDKNVPQFIQGDRDKIKQILTNLLSNAYKFTDSGSVVLKVALINVNKEESLEFSITDTGIGIPDNKIDTIYQRFQQLDMSNSRKYGGIGLGLAIVKELLFLMGGTINVKSTLSQGSTFTVSIPVKGLNIAAEERKEGVSKKQIVCLLAEDNKANQLLVYNIIKKYGYHIDVADNGEEVISMVKIKDYDIILMDLQMPVIDGYEAAKAIRDLEKTSGRRVPIIALTANATKEDMLKSKHAGMDDFITKPLRTKILFEKINQYIS
ncbi:response regulator [Mobilitalea sibirica]|uniref:Circadian input-output histidine kinase CikA n=1 Tax=Mobilitalea sibirica TaxID=1462919 RepID=A0A8J7H0H8_9FIRM|nr:histidine kinase N-terminal 7TM domain-containing protein [Mobilitalea sibirica]MBH1939572.1 response regulator [Mobilitalea sibirica]